jgi:exopolysaccharide biosynthesis protein
LILRGQRPTILLQAALGLLLAAFGCGTPVDAPINISWSPIAELNAGLPEAVRVYQGVDSQAPLRAWYVSVMPAAGVSVQVAASADDADGVETGSEFASRTRARVVLNAGYFRMGEEPMRHVGLLMVDGQIIEPAVDSVLRDGSRYFLARGALGFMADGTPDIAWVSSRDGILYEWEDPPPNAPDTRVTELELDGLAEWGARHAVAAGPVLVMDGAMRVATNAEVFFGTTIPEVHPRTAAGTTSDGRLIVAVVDGRQRDSRGLDLAELAALMLDLGCVEAVNLDGGGSSTLGVDGTLVNRPLGGEFQREIMSALLILEE